MAFSKDKHQALKMRYSTRMQHIITTNKHNSTQTWSNRTDTLLRSSSEKKPLNLTLNPKASVSIKVPLIPEALACSLGTWTGGVDQFHMYVFVVWMIDANLQSSFEESQLKHTLCSEKQSH